MLTRKQLEAKQGITEAHRSWHTSTLALLDSLMNPQNAEEVERIRSMCLKMDGLYKLLECIDDEDEVRSIANEAFALHDAITPCVYALVLNGADTRKAH